MLKKVFVIIITGTSLLFSFDRFTNYSSTTKISDFYSRGDTLWVASSGGLYIFEKSKGTGTLLGSSSSSIPDPNISSLCTDASSDLWISTKEGYLGKKTNNGMQVLNNSILAAGWRINCIASYKNYILIGTSKGLSVFNTTTMKIEKNATSFKPLTSSFVNTLKIIDDMLYVGLEDGIAEMNLANDNLKNVNLFDPTTAWTTDANTKTVRCFAVQSNSLNPFSGPADYFKNKLVYCKDSTQLFWGNDSIVRFPSAITVIKSFGDNECWIGTEYDHFFKWDGRNFTYYPIPGPTFTSATSVFVDNTGTLWTIPEIKEKEYSWWKAIHAFDGWNWKLYSWSKIHSMGHFGENADFYAMAQTKDGRMWFGASGGSVKCFVPEKNEWSVFCTGYADNGTLYHSFNGPCDTLWAKCDAIAQDSSGFIWMSSFKNTIGCLIIYDPHFEPDPGSSAPLLAHYRRLFPSPDMDIRCITVDKYGNVITGDDKGEIKVLHYSGNPLTANIDSTDRFSAGGKILDEETTSDGFTRIVSEKGVYLYDPGNKTFTKNETLTENITCIKAENNNTFWLGTKENGIIRYETQSNSKQVFTQNQGLISNNINSIFIDRKNGCLWAATDLGVSRLAIGYSIDANTKRNILAYPNPFSKARGTQINFENVTAGGFVEIYTLNGNLLAKALEQRKSTNGSLFTWKPSASVVPGTYFYRISAGGYSKTGKLLITP